MTKAESFFEKPSQNSGAEKPSIDEQTAHTRTSLRPILIASGTAVVLVATSFSVWKVIHDNRAQQRAIDLAVSKTSDNSGHGLSGEKFSGSHYDIQNIPNDSKIPDVLEVQLPDRILKLFGQEKAEKGLETMVITKLEDDLTDAEIFVLSQSQAIKVLSLPGGKITDEGLGYLQPTASLTDLELFNAVKITDKGLQNLEGMESLERLYLSHASITNEGLQSLEGLQNLKSLDLSYTQITDEGMSVIGEKLSKLRFLNIQGTKITSAGLRAIQQTRSPGEGQIMIHIGQTDFVKNEAPQLQDIIDNNIKRRMPIIDFQTEVKDTAQDFSQYQTPGDWFKLAEKIKSADR